MIYVSSFPSVLSSVPVVDIIDTEIGSLTLLHVESNEIDASNILGDISLNQTLPNSTYTSPTIQHRNESITISNRPHRTHKLPAYLHDYILPKSISKQISTNVLSLNTAFSKYQNITPDVLEHESQVLVRNISSNDEPSHMRKQPSILLGN